MKVAVLLGRGVEGCGCTRCAVEFMKAVPGSKIIATIDKKWPRRESMDFEKTEFKAADWDICEKIVDVINNHFDAVIVHSVPSTKHPQECIDNFVKMVENITVPKVGIQVDHSIHSISRNARFDEICNSLELLMTHSLTNDFSRWTKKPEKEFGSGRTVEVTTPVTTMGLGFDFDGHRAKYWVPIEEQDAFEVRWIGRTAKWKGPGLMIDFHNEALRSHGYRTIMEGLEASINFPQVLWKDAFDKQVPRDVVNFFRPRKYYCTKCLLDFEDHFRDKYKDQLRAQFKNNPQYCPTCNNELNEGGSFVHGEEVHGAAPYLYIPYNNHECMERMKYSAFGSDLYYLKAKMYGNNIENCHAECIASGTIPIFHKHFGDNVVHRVQGKVCTECKDTGTIFLDETNFKECAELMVKLSKDNKMRDEYREMSFEFWKQHADSKIVAQEILDKIVNRDSFKSEDK